MKSYIPDYPRPQFVRESWQNLNGIWNFAFDDNKESLAHGWERGLPGKTQSRSLLLMRPGPVELAMKQCIHVFGIAAASPLARAR